MRTPYPALVVAVVFVLGGLVGASALLAPKRDAAAPRFIPAWHEVRWPFPMDQWGTGTAFRCDAADCGMELTVYLRAKIGFCNCSGLTDDADLDRISDVDLFGRALYPQAASVPIKAAWLQGRSRPFAIRDALGRDATMIAVGLHDHCDALVASTVIPRGALNAAEPMLQQFLDSKAFADWAETTLGL